MAETLQQALDYINEILPNRINSTTIIMFINQEQRKIWHSLTSTNMYEFETSSGVSLYSLPTDCELEYIVENGIQISDSTGAVTSTTLWNTYDYAGADEELTGSRYYEALDNFGLYPVPEQTGLKGRIRYQERPTLFASTDTGISFNLDEDWIDFIKFKVMSRIAKSGNNPDVELANNYEADAIEIKKDLEMRKKKEEVKTPRYRYSYKDGWED